MTDYKDLNLDRETLDEQIQNFMKSKGYSIDGEIETTIKKKRVSFGAAGGSVAQIL